MLAEIWGAATSSFFVITTLAWIVGSVVTGYSIEYNFLVCSKTSNQNSLTRFETAISSYHPLKYPHSACSNHQRSHLFRIVVIIGWTGKLMSDGGMSDRGILTCSQSPFSSSRVDISQTNQRSYASILRLARSIYEIDHSLLVCVDGRKLLFTSLYHPSNQEFKK